MYCVFLYYPATIAFLDNVDVIYSIFYEGFVVITCRFTTVELVIHANLLKFGIAHHHVFRLE